MKFWWITLLLGWFVLGVGLVNAQQCDGPSYCAAACNESSTKCTCHRVECLNGKTSPDSDDPNKCTYRPNGGYCRNGIPGAHGCTTSCTACFNTSALNDCPSYFGNGCYRDCSVATPVPSGSGGPGPTSNPTPPLPPAGQSWCEVSFNGLSTVNEGDSIAVMAQGLAAGGGSLSLAVMKTDGTMITNPIVTKANSGVLDGTSAVTTLPVGNYNFFCYVTGATNSCTGNPLGTGGLLDCGVNDVAPASVVAVNTSVTARVYDDPTMSCATTTPYAAGTSGTVFMTANQVGVAPLLTFKALIAVPVLT
jgi:hypothetical protein